jgi:Predicted pyridoxal phosphate-dependent enzyme apparently involved in regulation of cell wall biogenesis
MKKIFEPFSETINVTCPTFPNKDKFQEKLDIIWKNKYLTNNGPLHEELKMELKKYLVTNNLELFTNGHLSLEIALMALDITGEVITTPFTFASTTQAIINVGATPIFCEIENKTLNIDTSKIEDLISEKTEAIMAVHVFGNPCNVEAIEKIAKKYNLKVIYDAAHAFGVKINGRDISSYGDISMFSFHATKVFHTIEGGALIFKDATLTEKIKSLKNFGIIESGEIPYVGTNAKMNEIQAAMGLCNLEQLSINLEKRKLIYETYLNEFSNKGELTLNYINFKDLNMDKYNFAYFPIILKNNRIRDMLFDKCAEYNFVVRKYFYPLCSSFVDSKFAPKETPFAKKISDTILCVPIYSDLDICDVKKISKIILQELSVLEEKNEL